MPPRLHPVWSYCCLSWCFPSCSSSFSPWKLWQRFASCVTECTKSSDFPKDKHIKELTKYVPVYSRPIHFFSCMSLALFAFLVLLLLFFGLVCLPFLLLFKDHDSVLDALKDLWDRYNSFASLPPRSSLFSLSPQRVCVCECCPLFVTWCHEKWWLQYPRTRECVCGPYGRNCFIFFGSATPLLAGSTFGSLSLPSASHKLRSPDGKCATNRSNRGQSN